MKILRSLFVLVALLAAGCINVDLTLGVRDDASGSCTVTYSLPEQAVEQLIALRKLRDDILKVSGKPPGPDPKEFSHLLLNPSDAGLKRELARYEKYGVKVDRLKVESRNTRRIVTIKILFRDLSELARTEFFQEHGFSVVKTKKGNYWLHREAKKNEEAKAVDFSDPQTLQLLTPIFAGFKVVVRINTPGKILRTNAHRQSVYTASWSFDFNDDAGAVAAFQNQNIDIVFDGSRLDLPRILQKRPETSEASAPAE